MLAMDLSASIDEVTTELEQALGIKGRSHLLRNIGFATAGVTVVALGLVIGRELRQRYKFNRRTPYDFYAHSGDSQDMEFGVGI